MITVSLRGLKLAGGCPYAAPVAPRPELIVAGVLVAAGGTALGASLASEEGSESRAPAAPPADAEAAEAEATQPEAPVVLRIRVDGRVLRLPASRIGFAYCARREAVCAAVRRSDERKLSPRQRRALRVARAKQRALERRRRELLEEEVLRAAPPPAQPAAPPPPAQPVPPQPEPEPTTTTG